MSTVPRTERQSTRFQSLLAVISLIVLFLVGSLLYQHNHQTSYQAVITQFRSALGNGDSATVLSLESPAFQSQIKTETSNEAQTPGQHGAIITSNFYSLSQSNHQLSEFAPNFLKSAKITTGSYTARNGIKGHSEIFKTKTNDYGAPSYSPSFIVNVIPSGNSWLVDGVILFASGGVAH